MHPTDYPMELPDTECADISHLLFDSLQKHDAILISTKWLTGAIVKPSTPQLQRRFVEKTYLEDDGKKGSPISWDTGRADNAITCVGQLMDVIIFGPMQLALDNTTLFLYGVGNDVATEMGIQRSALSAQTQECLSLMEAYKDNFFNVTTEIGFTVTRLSDFCFNVSLNRSDLRKGIAMAILLLLLQEDIITDFKTDNGRIIINTVLQQIIAKSYLAKVENKMNTGDRMLDLLGVNRANTHLIMDNEGKEVAKRNLLDMSSFVTAINDTQNIRFFIENTFQALLLLQGNGDASKSIQHGKQYLLGIHPEIKTVMSEAQ
jgi:hypothetical protein